MADPEEKVYKQCNQTRLISCLSTSLYHETNHTSMLLTQPNGTLIFKYVSRQKMTSLNTVCINYALLIEDYHFNTCLSCTLIKYDIWHDFGVQVDRS